MSDMIIFFSTFYILLISVIGYGNLFQKIFFSSSYQLEHNDNAYVGFYGLFFLTLISLISNLVTPHNFIHNIVVHSLGIFFFFKIKKKKLYLKYIFLISLFVISALLISKTHDDFSYYHLPVTKYLTEHKIIFGTANLGHGYKLLSSLFFLNSIFYLPFVEYYSFHFSLLFFLIFFNFFIINEIFLKKNYGVIKILFIFAFCFFNLSFNRLAEYGTDKVGQLLIVIVVIKLFQIICYENNKNQIKKILYLVPLLGLCITLKTYFLSYLALGILVFFVDQKFKIIMKSLFLSKLFLIFLILLSFNFLHHFIATGCIVSPLSFTCFGNNLDWALSKNSYHNLSLWLEQWAKGGAGPNFREKDPLNYIKNFNWISNWYEIYFKEKVLDQLGIFFSVAIFVLFLFKKLKFNRRIKKLNLKIILFYMIIILIFLIWLSNHPQLRYGGYAIIFLVFAIPLAIIFEQMKNRNNFNIKFSQIIFIVLIIFNLKNILRIDNEFKRSDIYKYNNFPYFAILFQDYISDRKSVKLTINQVKHHCWNTPSLCTQGSTSKISVKKINGYYFLYKE